MSSTTPLSSLLAKKAAALTTTSSVASVASYLEKNIFGEYLHVLQFNSVFKKHLELIPLTPTIAATLKEILYPDTSLEVTRKSISTPALASKLAALKVKVATLPKELIAFLEARSWNWRISSTSYMYLWLQVRPKSNELSISQAIALTELGLPLPTGFTAIRPTLFTSSKLSEETRVLALATLLFKQTANYSRFVRQFGITDTAATNFTSSTDLLDAITQYYSPLYVNAKIFGEPLHRKTSSLSTLTVDLLQKLNYTVDFNKLYPVIRTPDHIAFDYIPSTKTEESPWHRALSFTIEQVCAIAKPSEIPTLKKHFAPEYLPYFIQKTGTDYTYAVTKSDVLSLFSELVRSNSVLFSNVVCKHLKDRLSLTGVTTKELTDRLKAVTYAQHLYLFKFVRQLQKTGLTIAELMEIFPLHTLEINEATPLLKSAPTELSIWIKNGLQFPPLNEVISYLNSNPLQAGHEWDRFCKHYKPYLIAIGSNPEIVEALPEEYQSTVCTLLDLIEHLATENKD